MKATAEKIASNTVLLEVEVEAEKFAQALDRAYRKIVKYVAIPGFRKGRAPRVLVERHLGKQVLVDEAMEILIPEAYEKAVADTGIEPVAQPELEIVQAEEGKPVVFKAKVVVKPEVELGQYTGLEVEKPASDVQEEEIEQELKKLQERHARLEKIEEGTVEKGDLVTIDFEGRIDEEKVAAASGNDYVLEVGSGTFVADFEEQLVGMRPGETRTFAVTFPQDYPGTEVAGKEVTFTVTLKELRRKELLPLDDEFARDVSEFDTLEELKTDIKNKLEQRKKTSAEAEVRRRVIKQAVDNARVEIPKEMIDAKALEMARDIERQLMFQGLNLEHYLRYTNTSFESFMENLRPSAEAAVKTELVLEAIAKKENITVSEEELNEAIEKYSKEENMNIEMLKKLLTAKDKIEAYRQALINDKTVNFLVDNAKIVEKDAAAAPAEAVTSEVENNGGEKMVENETQAGAEG